MTLQLGGFSALQTAVERAARVNLDACLQCGCCSGGCTGIEYMDYGPRQIIQLIKADRSDVLFQSEAIWFCASCHICEDRCPAGIRISAVMDSLREIAWHDAAQTAQNAQQLFHAMFLDHIAAFGRLEEGMFAFLYSRRAKTPLPKPKLLWRMLRRGRVRPSLPRRASGSFRKLCRMLRQKEADET